MEFEKITKRSQGEVTFKPEAYILVNMKTRRHMWNWFKVYNEPSGIPVFIFTSETRQ